MTITTAAVRWLMAISFCALFLAAQVLDAPETDDTVGERMHQVARDMAGVDARMQRAARSLCDAEAGPASTVLWTTDGDLVCRPTPAQAQALLAGAAAP